MSRFLFATVPLAGHTQPGLPIAKALIDRGHSVRWYTGVAFADKVRAVGATFSPMTEYDFSVAGLDGYYPERRSLSGLRQVQFDTVASFARPLSSQISDVQALLADEPADVLVGDIGFLAGPMLRELGGPPFAAFGISVVNVPSPDIPPFGLGLRPTRGPIGRLRNASLDRLLKALLFKPMFTAIHTQRAAHQLPRLANLNIGYPTGSALFLQLSTPGFDYPRTDLPAELHFVGPARPVVDPAWQPPSWWAELQSGRRVVLVTQGTVATQIDDLLRPTLSGLAAEDVLVVAVTGGPDPAELHPLPGNVRVERYVPFERLLPYVDVLVTNGGYGGVQQALSHGVPIVAAGKTEDKMEVSARVAFTGVGLNLKTQRPTPTQVRRAVRRILTDRRYRETAASIRTEIERAGGEEEAASLLEQLAARNCAVS